MSQDNWLNSKGISSIRSPSSEKASKMCTNIGIFWHLPTTAILDHILDVFSGLRDQIKVIPFASSHASYFRIPKWGLTLCPSCGDLNSNICNGKNIVSSYNVIGNYIRYLWNVNIMEKWWMTHHGIHIQHRPRYFGAWVRVLNLHSSHYFLLFPFHFYFF